MTKTDQAAYYRGSAASLREIASGVLDPEIKSELLLIADRFDLLAQRVESWRHAQER